MSGLGFHGEVGRKGVSSVSMYINDKKVPNKRVMGSNSVVSRPPPAVKSSTMPMKKSLRPPPPVQHTNVIPQRTTGSRVRTQTTTKSKTKKNMEKDEVSIFGSADPHGLNNLSIKDKNNTQVQIKEIDIENNSSDLDKKILERIMKAQEINGLQKSQTSRDKISEDEEEMIIVEKHKYPRGIRSVRKIRDTRVDDEQEDEDYPTFEDDPEFEKESASDEEQGQNQRQELQQEIDDLKLSLQRSEFARQNLEVSLKSLVSDVDSLRMSMNQKGLDGSSIHDEIKRELKAKEDHMIQQIRNNEKNFETKLNLISRETAKSNGELKDLISNINQRSYWFYGIVSNKKGVRIYEKDNRNKTLSQCNYQETLLLQGSMRKTSTDEIFIDCRYVDQNGQSFLGEVLLFDGTSNNFSTFSTVSSCVAK